MYGCDDDAFECGDGESLGVAVAAGFDLVYGEGVSEELLLFSGSHLLDLHS